MSLSYSDAALRAYFAKELLHMTNAHCWKQFSEPRALSQAAERDPAALELLDAECRRGAAVVGADGMICAFDKDFPLINPFVPEGERPFLLFYRGNLSLLADLNKNVAVIGAVDPDTDVVQRERNIVGHLTEKGFTIVSGLANGCDAEAHRACLETGGKTVAILPTQLEKIYPAKNRGLAEEIVKNDGLLLTEYAGEPKGRSGAVKRFSDRDRLQAMFSRAVIMIASHRRGEGDSGSRYAMEAAKRYRIGRYIMYDPTQDEGKSLFGLNQDLKKNEADVKILYPSAIENLAVAPDPKLYPKETGEQLGLDIG